MMKESAMLIARAFSPSVCAALVELSRNIVDYCTRVVNANLETLTEAQQAIQDRNCKPLEGDVVPPPPCLHGQYHSQP